MNYSTKFWDFVAENFAEKPVKDAAAYQKKLAATQHYFRPDMQVLEFGCGSGSTAIIHAPHVGQYKAIDTSPKMIAIAQKNLAKQNINNLEFYVAAIEQLNVEEQSLDAVLGLGILYLLNDHEKVIQLIYNMLKPGGVFISNTICVSETMPILRFILPIGTFLRLMPKINVFSKKALENSIKQTGFNIDYKWTPESDKQVYFLIASKPM